MFIDGAKNQSYDSIVEGQFIEVNDLGRFVISSVSIESIGKDIEYKECEAIGIETLLGQKYLELFTINMGTVESIDGVKLYNLSNPNKSLLHLALEKCPDWTIGHVDTSLMSVERCFELTRQDVYSFLTQDVATAFQCVVLFDTLHRRINIYKEDSVGDNTNVFVTYDNLLKSTNLSSSFDDIKTCLTVTGADDINLREVNMGYDRIYMLDYFHSLEFMSVGLYNAYSNWIKKWNNNLSNYSSLLSQYQNFYNQINNLTNEKMPSNPQSTNWAEYGLVPLKEKLATYEQKQAVMIKAGQGDKNHKDYNSLYLPVFNTINLIKSQISIVENQISSLKTQQNSIGKQMDAIISDIDMKNNFTSEQLQELSNFIHEDELSSSNFVVTDTMTDSERMDMLKEMLEFGQKELRKVSQPQLQFSAEMLNLFEMDEFENCSADFEPGNYINIILRDDYIIKARLLTVDIDFYHPNNFSVTFGNTNKVKGKNIYTDITKAIDTATSVATTVSFNSSNWNQANKDADSISKMISDGLLTAGESIRTSKSDVSIDDRGILISNTSESKYPNDRIFIGNSQILFSDDDLKTIKTALGRVQYTKKGITYNDFGLIAHLVLAGYISGSTIEGNEIIAGSITGTDFNNGNGTFHVDSNGKLVASSASITGEINANSGRIGGNNGFTIKDGKFYSGNKSSFSSNNSGVYVGTDGISLGINNAFHVDSNGKLVANDATVTGTFEATGGHIGGWKITTTDLYNDNSNKSAGIGSFGTTFAFWAGRDYANRNSAPFRVGHEGAVYASNITATGGTIGGAHINDNSIYTNNWWIKSDGTATFKDVFISNVRSGSNLGGISIGDYGNTYGNFNNGLYANTSFGLNGGALNNFNDLVVNNITADLVSAKAIEAGFITAGSISSTYATINDLNAATARIGTLESDHVSTNDLSAYRLKATKIKAEELTFQGNNVSWASLPVISTVSGTTISYVDHSGNKKQVNVITNVYSKNIYAMASD